MSVYLDNAATTRVRPEAEEAALLAMREEYGNPSSTYALGRRAAETLENARADVASVVAADPEEIFFTSGGTESDNWAILGGAEAAKRRGNHIITSLAEHPAVLRSAEKLTLQGYDVTFLRPDKSGVITVDALAGALRDDTALVSLMLANNETGAINPVAGYSAEIKRRGLKTLLHTDAVQAYGKLPVTVKTLGVDLMSVSAHKIYGCKGAGALYIRRGLKLPPLLVGGGQESNLRGGTQATPALAAFGAAARLAGVELERNYKHAAILKNLAATVITREIPDAVIISDGGSPYILSLSLPGHRSETLMSALETDEIYVSRSSACKKGAVSHVLQAMSLPPAVIDGALRVSFSRDTTEEEVLFLAEKLKTAAETLFRRR
ncbi:MAG: cysteine desulfurase [Oscillospiraceae bacterium]|jgi:cysteine desulfurase|nr:cysteine desulfurase [Oscillospiraceae bacterium]